MFSFRPAAFAAAFVALGSGAHAFETLEIGDFGATPATAFVLAAGTDEIYGTISPDDPYGADLYVFSLAAPTTLKIEMLMAGGDANLLLFDALGRGLALGRLDLSRPRGSERRDLRVALTQLIREAVSIGGQRVEVRRMPRDIGLERRDGRVVPLLGDGVLVFDRSELVPRP